ncbi:MAG TPA: alpha/beta hydrolase [Flavobacterium sp.]|nr:alpha/beta hydrolase [Flavobacterium sp.]
MTFPKNTLSIILSAAFTLLSISFYANGTANDLPKKPIAEARFIPINGIDQWVTIKGDSSKPVILFLHGGPGSPVSPYTNTQFAEWEKDFVIVQWDQRGSGRTFGRTAPAELNPEYLKANPLTVNQVAADGITLTEYLIKYLGKEKVILFGTSWGSVVGASMALKRPDLFAAYVGHSQIVNPSENFVKTYKKMHDMVQKANDTISLQTLDAMGPPPYASAKNSGKLMRVIKKYERSASTPAPETWFTLAPEYDNEKDNKNREDGDDYSFVNYAGDERLGVASMVADINFMKNGLVFKTPVYFIQGEEDITTPAASTKAYFDKITAPEKQYILLPKAAHGFNEAVVNAQYKIFKGIVVK